MQVWAQHVEPESRNLTEWQVAELIITVPPPLGIKDQLCVEEAFHLVQGFVIATYPPCMQVLTTAPSPHRFGIKPEFEGAGLPFERVVEALTKRQYLLTCKDPTKIPGLTPEMQPEMQPEMSAAIREAEGGMADFFSGMAHAIEKTYSDAATSITPRGTAPKLGSDAATSITPRGPAPVPTTAPNPRPVNAATTARAAPDRAPDRAPTRDRAPDRAPTRAAPAPAPAPSQAAWQAPVAAPPERLDPKTPRGETQFTRRGVESKATFFERQGSGADETLTNGWNGGPAPVTAPSHVSTNGNGRDGARDSGRHGGGMKALPPPEALPPPQGQPLLRPQGHFASPLPLGSVPPVQALPRPPPGAPPQLPPGWYMAASSHGLTYYYNVETRQVPLMTTDDH